MLRLLQARLTRSSFRSLHVCSGLYQQPQFTQPLPGQSGNLPQNGSQFKEDSYGHAGFVATMLVSAVIGYIVKNETNVENPAVAPKILENKDDKVALEIDEPEVKSIESIDPVLEEDSEKVEESIIEPILELAAEQIEEPAAQQIKEPAAEPVVEQVSEPVVEQPAEPVVEPTVEQVLEPISEPTSIVELAAEQVAEPAVEPLIEQVAEPIAKPVEQAAEAVVEQVFESVVEEPTKPVVEPTVEQLVESTTEPTPIVKVAAEQATEPLVEQVVEPIAEQPLQTISELAKFEKIKIAEKKEKEEQKLEVEPKPQADQEPCQIVTEKIITKAEELPKISNTVTEETKPQNVASVAAPIAAEISIEKITETEKLITKVAAPKQDELETEEDSDFKI